jgi:tight adherence protein B
MVILITFALLSLLSFSIVVLLMRPRSSDSLADKRLKSVLGARSVASKMGPVDAALASANAEGPFAWIEEMLAGRTALRGLHRLLHQARSSWQAGTLIAVTVAAALALMLAVYAITNSAILCVPAALLCLCTPLMTLLWQRRRNLAAFERVLPDAIEMCARSLRAGHSLIAAIGIVAEEAAEPAKSEFAEVFRKQNFGMPIRDALIQMLERVPSRDLQIFVTGILVQKDTGGNLAEIMDRIVSVIRDRSRIQAEVRIHTAQGRFTGWVLCLLPVVLLLAINLISPGYSKVLFEEGVGRKLLYTGICLLTMGGFTIRRIVHGIEV